MIERAVVTGGAGFIGSHLVETLLASGTSVMVFDDFRLGRREHLAAVEPADRLTVVEGDIRSAGDLRALNDYAPDALFHLAALHFTPYCDARPQETLDVNVLGLDMVLRAVRDIPLARVLFVSSSAIYGFSDDPWRESAPARPGDVYGISKWMGEQVMTRFHADRPEVRTVVARLFNTYGPRETNPHVLPEVLKALTTGRPIELGNMWPKRDLIYVTDTAAAFAAAVRGAPGYEVFNVGTGRGTTIADVLQAIEGLLGRSLDIRRVPKRMRDRDGHLVCDPGRLIRATGWKPQYDLTAGLSRLLESEGLL
jgi:UDP-glucose 4-epimerase